MELSVGEQIKVILNRKNMTITQLASKLKTTRQNLTNKFARNNFSEKEIADIAKALNCKYSITLTMLNGEDKTNNKTPQE